MRLEELAGEALTTLRGLDAEGQELLGLAIDPGDRETDDGVPDDGGRDPRPVGETGEDESVRRAADRPAR